MRTDQRRTTFCLLATASCLTGALLPSAARAGKADAASVEFFEKKVRPVLVEHCYKCHSAEARKAGRP